MKCHACLSQARPLFLRQCPHMVTPTPRTFIIIMLSMITIIMAETTIVMSMMVIISIKITSTISSYINLFFDFSPNVSIQFHIDLSSQLLTRASQSSARHLDRLLPAELPARISLFLYNLHLQFGS